jgi:hypothetical protein
MVGTHRFCMCEAIMFHFRDPFCVVCCKCMELSSGGPWAFSEALGASAFCLMCKSAMAGCNF